VTRRNTVVVPRCELCGAELPDAGEGTARFCAVCRGADAKAASAAALGRATLDEGLPFPVGTELGTVRLTDLFRGLPGPIIYKAINSETKKPLCVVTAADADSADKFRKAVRAAAAVKHACVLPVVRMEEHRGIPCWFTEALNGGTLGEWVRRRGAPSPAKSVRIAAALGRALEAAHGKKLIHANLTPASVLLVEPELERSPEKRIRLADFGIAGAIDLSRPADSPDAPLHFLSPEQCRGEKANPASDQYALGCLLYFLLAGEPPFASASPFEIAFLQIRSPIPDVRNKCPGIPASILGILRRATAKDPGQRFRSVGEMAAELEAAGVPLERGATSRAVGSSVAAQIQEPEAADGTDPRVGTQFGDYRILKVLGRGRMGTVYEAVDTKLSRPAALKILSGDLASQGADVLAKFLREGRIASQLRHANIVSVYQAGKVGTSYFEAMELVRGGTASAFIRAQTRPLHPRTATRILLEAARGAAAANAHGVIHRDINPSNILLDARGTVKLGEFGCAKAAGGDPPSALGTPGFLSPEQLQGAAVDARTDVYSLGATYYALLVGKPPYTETDPEVIYRRQSKEAPPDPRRERPELPPDCGRIVAKAMTASASRRYQSVDELIADLETVNLEAAPGGSEGAVSDWLNQVSDAQAGDVADPELFEKRRKEKFWRTFRRYALPVLDWTRRQKKLWIVCAVLLALGIAFSVVWPMIAEPVRSNWNRLFS